MEWLEHGKVHYLEYNKRGKIVFHRFLFFSFTFIATPDGDGDAVLLLLLLMRRDASDVHSLDVYTTHTLHNIASFCFKWSLCPATHNRKAADGRAETRDVEGGREEASKGKKKGRDSIEEYIVQCFVLKGDVQGYFCNRVGNQSLKLLILLLCPSPPCRPPMWMASLSSSYFNHPVDPVSPNERTKRKK